MPVNQPEGCPWCENRTFAGGRDLWTATAPDGHGDILVEWYCNEYKESFWTEQKPEAKPNA